MNEVLRMAVMRAKLTNPVSEKIRANAEIKHEIERLELKREIDDLRAKNQELKNRIVYLEKIKKYRAAVERPSKNCDFKQILQLVAARSDFTEIALLGAGRNKLVVRWRHILMYLAHRFTGYSFPQIGRMLGNRDHTTILHGVQKLTAERIVNAQLDQLLAEFERELKHDAALAAVSSEAAAVLAPRPSPAAASPSPAVSA